MSHYVPVQRCILYTHNKITKNVKSEFGRLFTNIRDEQKEHGIPIKYLLLNSSNN